jgi:hypothetical protein
MAQAVVTEKYRQYEDLAARDGSQFHPNAGSPAARSPECEVHPCDGTFRSET